MAKELVTDKVVEDTATLSRLEFDRDEIKSLKKDLNEIISYFGVLEGIDTKGVPETVKTEGEPREDKFRSGITSDEVVKNAPAHNHNAFIVPRVVE